VPVAGSIFPARPTDRTPTWKSALHGAQILRPMGLNDHRNALKAAEQRIESIKVSL
jgi:hypothetical protein